MSPISSVLCANPAHIRDLIADLSPGLILTNDLVSFADEDFEHFLGDAAASAIPEIRALAADYMMAKRIVDPYAASHVASLALLAQRREDVIALVREPVTDYPITDPAMRGEVHRRRLRAAMHVCRETGNVVDAAALLLEGAQALKTDDAMNGTLFKHVELAANFSRDAIFALLLRNRDKRPRHGALLLQLAGINGVAGDRIGMKSHFRGFLAWQEGRHDAQQEFEVDEDENASDDGESEAELQRRKRDIARKDFERVWRLKADDVAAFLVGQLHAEGTAEIVALIRRPRPARFRLAVLRRLVMRLARRGDIAELLKLRDVLPNRHPGRAMAELAVALCGGDFNAEAMLFRLEVMAIHGGFSELSVGSGHMKDSPTAEMLRFVLDAADLVAMHGGDAKRLAAVDPSETGLRPVGR